MEGIGSRGGDGRRRRWEIGGGEECLRGGDGGDG